MIKCVYQRNRKLGVKDLEGFNLSLLSKWKWRFLEDKEASWYEILSFGYGDLARESIGSGESMTHKNSSICWRNVITVGDVVWQSNMELETCCILRKLI